MPIIVDVEADVYRKHGISFSSLSHLDSIGLITFDAVSNYVRRELPEEIQPYYHGKRFGLRLPQPTNNTIVLGKALLTQSRQQLAPISGSTPIDGFAEYVLKWWYAQGASVFSVLPARSSQPRSQD